MSGLLRYISKVRHLPYQRPRSASIVVGCTAFARSPDSKGSICCHSAERAHPLMAEVLRLCFCLRSLQKPQLVCLVWIKKGKTLRLQGFFGAVCSIRRLREVPALTCIHVGSFNLRDLALEQSTPQNGNRTFKTFQQAVRDLRPHMRGRPWSFLERTLILEANHTHTQKGSVHH